MNITIAHIDTACVLIEINGYRILTDPTLDAAGQLYYHGAGTFSRKTGNPTLPPGGLGHIDLILLSHHQHKDNFDHKGRELAMSGCQILSTRSAAKSIKGITGLAPWQSYKINTPLVPGLAVTATPAQHHPWWIPEFVSGEVIGFVLEFPAQKKGALYISGDTVFFSGIREVAKRFSIDIALFHLGSVQVRYLTGFGQYTMDGRQLLKAVEVINPNTVIPIHHNGWSHFKEKESTLRKIIDADPALAQKTVFLQPGIPRKF